MSWTFQDADLGNKTENYSNAEAVKRRAFDLIAECIDEPLNEAVATMSVRDPDGKLYAVRVSNVRFDIELEYIEEG